MLVKRSKHYHHYNFLGIAKKYKSTKAIYTITRFYLEKQKEYNSYC